MLSFNLEIKIPHLSRYGTLYIFLHFIPLPADAFSTPLANSAKEAPTHNRNQAGHVRVLNYFPPLFFCLISGLRQAVFSIKVRLYCSLSIYGCLGNKIGEGTKLLLMTEGGL